MYLENFEKDGYHVSLEDHPELQIHMMDHNSEWAKKGNVEIGGQLLCKMPEEKAKLEMNTLNNIAQSLNWNL